MNKVSIFSAFFLLFHALCGSVVLAATERVDGIEWSYRIDDGHAIIEKEWGASAIDSETAGAITIPNKLGGCPVTSIGVFAFWCCRNLQSVIIPDSVTELQMDSFAFCSGLKSISFPESLRYIGEASFYECTSLSEVTIPEGCLAIDSYAFENCSRLRYVSIPDSITTIWNAFAGCSNLCNVSVPVNDIINASGGWNGHIASLFGNASGITNLTISAGSTNVPPATFLGCTNLLNIAVADGNTHLVSIDGCVYSSDGLSLLAVPGGKSVYAVPSSVSTIAAYAFTSCNRLTSLIIPSNVTSIEQSAFADCSNLKWILLSREFEALIPTFSLAPNCLVRYTDDSVNLDVFSQHGTPSFLGATAFVISSVIDSGISCNVDLIVPDSRSSNVRYVCSGWKGTGSVPATGMGTNCTFVLTEDSTLEWQWKTNVWISLAVDGDGTSAFRHGWFDGLEPAVVPFDAPAGLLYCTLSGDADGVTVDAAARTVSIPTDRPRAVSLHLESLCKAVGTDGKFVDYSFDGDAPWIPLADESLSDRRCLRSGVVGSGETSVLETRLSGAGRISFRWKASCNRGDYCKFIVDDTEVASISRTATEWATVDHELGEGNHVIRWSWEKSASAVLGENGAFLDDIRWRPYVDLTVVSADGTPSPAVGATRYLYGDVVEASVAEPAAGAKTRRVCTGRTGTGSVPASGTDLATTFAITNDSTLVWNWRTEHWIDIRARGAAKTDFTACWLPEGSIATVEFTPTAPVAATAVLGDSAGTTLDGLTLTVPVDGPRTVTVRVTAPNLALDVASAHGGAVPAPGRSWYEWGTEIDASVAEPTPSNGVQYVCTGWTGTGSVPASGAGTNAAFTVGEASSLTWNWQTNVWLSLSCTGRVIASLSGEWVEKGTTKRVEYVPLTEFHDLKLTGDADGVVWDRAARTLDVPADRPRDLALSLTTLTLRTALDAEGFSWTTSGAVDWIPQVETSADGVDAARAGGIATGEESYLATTVSGPGTLSWSWMLDADGVLGVDVELDGNYALSLETSGVWLDDTLDVAGEGDHDIRFVFWNEDPDATNRTERAFLDRVSWTGAPPSPPVTKTSPVPVPHDWLANHASAFLAETGGDYETAAGAIAANGRTVWECFVAGLEPEDPASDFRVLIAVSNGVPDIAFDPFLESGRVYEVEGKETLDGEWGLTNATSRFFRGKVSLLDGWAPDGVDGFPEVVTVTFDANGGTVAPSSISFTRTGNGLLGAVPTPVGADVLFGGWFTELDGGIRFDQWSPLPWIDLSLFAHWNVSLAFDPNGGEGTMPGIVAPRGQSVTLPESGFDKVGHSFGGWAATAASEASWQPGESVAFETTRTLFADWDVDRHSIAFDSAGGSAVPPLELDYGAAVVAPAPPVWDGYAFTGWTPPLPETMPASNLVVTATWRLDPATLSFDTAGGTAIAPIVQNVGTPVVRPADPTRTGYTFAGWSPAFPATMPGSDTTLVAQWTPNRYLVRFRQNGGSGGMLDQEMVYDESSALTTDRFVKAGHSFAGWATSSDGSALYADGASVRNLAIGANDLVELFATWRINPYTISFDSNGGSAVPAITQDYGTSVTAPDNPLRTGYTFAVWSPAIPSTMPPSNVVCVAHWTPNQYAIRFDANGGTGEMDDLECTYGETSDLPGSSFAGPDGAAFIGWSSSADGIVEYAAGSTVFNWSSTNNAVIPLYAKWNRGSFTIHFDANGGMGEMPDQAFTLDVQQSLAANAFSKTNRFFSGWSTNGTDEIVFEDGCAVVNLAGAGETTILRAIWRETAPGLALWYYDIDGYYNYSTWTGSESAMLGDFANRSFALETTTLGWGETLDAGMTSANSSMELRYLNGGLSTEGLQLNSATNRFHGKYANDSQDYFSIFGTGLLWIGESGLYEFGVVSDDRFVLYVDGVRVVQSSRSVGKGSLNLPSGWHRIAFGYAEQPGGQGVSVQWKKPGDTSFAPIPQSVLFHRTGTDLASFHPNGGTGEMTDIAVDRNFGAELPACTLTKTGHSFSGWATNETGEAVFDVDSWIPPDITDLYATWRANRYSIQFDSNGGNDVSTITQDYGTSVLAPVEPVRTGYAFAGWSPAVPATMPPSNVVCIAQWTPNRYTVRFNANGGTGEMQDLECFYDEVSLESNGLSVKYYDLSSSGYSTWTQSEAAMKSYFDDKTPTMATNTLDWGEGLDAGFSNPTGSDGNNWVSSGMTRPNATCLFHEGYASSSKERFAVLLDGCLSVTDSGTYQFAAVADDAVVLYVDGANVLVNGQNWGYMATGEIALSAGFHSVSIGFYEKTGGQGLSVQWKKPGDSSFTPIPQSALWSAISGTALPAVAFSGPNAAAFLGWSTSPDGLVEFADAERVSNLSSVDGAVVNLYAKWNRGSFTVHFDANGGTGEMPDQAFTLDVPQNLATNAFSKPNHAFAGWATNENGNVVFGNGAMVHNLATAEATVTLWAVWLPPYMVVNLSGGSSATSYPVAYLAEPPEGGFNTDEYKTTKLVLRRLEPGPVPTRDATLTKPFYVGLFEVTQKQWSLVTGGNPSSFSGDTLPVESISYNAIRGSNAGAGWPTSNVVDSDSFLGKLRARTGIDFDLPTEAQWEYACRAGSTTAYSYGDSADGAYMWYSSNSSSQTHEVGTKLPNPWGLYDMHGNVWEWCLDWYGGSLSGNDPVGSSSESYRVIRGGSWNSGAGYCTSSYRDSGSPSGSYRDYGFRLVRTLSNE